MTDMGKSLRKKPKKCVFPYIVEQVFGRVCVCVCVVHMREDGGGGGGGGNNLGCLSK